MTARATALALAATLAAACGGASTAPPPTPGGVGATSPIPGAVAVTWDAVAGATSYAVSIRPDGAASGTAAAAASPPAFRDGLAPGSRALVSVSAVGPTGEGPRSAEVPVDVAPLAEVAAGPVAADRVALQWTPVSSGTYAVYRSTSLPVDPATAVRLDAATASYDDATVDPDTTYHYAVAGVWDGHESPPGPPLTVTTPPGAPAALAATGGDRVVALAWSAVPGATGYTPLCGTAPGVPEAATAFAATSGLAATVGPVAPGTAYSCWIRSESAAGHGLLSPEAIALTLPAAPDVLAESSLGAVSVTWPAVASATSYEVTWAIGAAAPATATVDAAAACGAAGCAWSPSGVAPGDVVAVSIAARNATGLGPASATASVTVSPAPTPRVVGWTDASVSLAWDPIAGAAGYAVYRASSLPLSTATAVRLDAGAATSLVDPSAAPDTAYRYAVAIVVGGVESAPGGTAAVTTLPAPPVVAAGPGPGEGQVTVSWTDARNHAVTYDLYWADSAPATLASTRIAGATSPFVLSGLDASRTYHFAVVAVGAGGESALSNDAAASPYPTTKLSEPVAARGVTGFAQTVPAAAGGLEVFPGQANDWDLDADLSVATGGYWDGPFAGAMWLYAGQLATSPPTYDTLRAETFQLDAFPADQAYAELTFSTPLFGAADGVETLAFSDGAALGLPALSGARSAFLNGTSDSRLAQAIDLRGATSATLSWSELDAWSPAPGLATELGPYFRATLRDPATGALVATLAPSCGPPDPTTGAVACTADLGAGLGAQVVLSFELRAASPGIVELDDVALAGAGAPGVANGGFEADGGWTTNAPAEPQNVTSGARTLCTRRTSGSCAESLRVTRTFFTAPSSPWARWVDVFENPGTADVSADVVYVVAAGTSTILYAPAGAGGAALSALDATGTYHDFGLAFGDATPFYASAAVQPDGSVTAGGGYVFLVRRVTVPAGGRVALATFAALDGASSGGAGGTSAPAIDAAVTGIATGFRSHTDTSYRDWTTAAQLGAIANW